MTETNACRFKNYKIIRFVSECKTQIYLYSNIPQPIRIRLVNMEIDKPMTKMLQLKISCFIIKLSVVPAKTRL